ncbi:hypothetical protein [Anaerospora sp.]|uniref:hypothetical protein n=1 Tax=Anaerospora sp. TaxID=1960278 RepID=UPI00289B8D14|nr:hypothetical protein [Anaerospora sp.]
MREEHGLQVFNSSGDLILDVTDRFTRVLGEFDTGYVNGSIEDINLLEGIPWCYCYIPSQTGINQRRPISITFSGSTLTWNFDDARKSQTNTVSFKVIYGVM